MGRSDARLRPGGAAVPLAAARPRPGIAGPYQALRRTPSSRSGSGYRQSSEETVARECASRGASDRFGACDTFWLCQDECFSKRARSDHAL